LNAVLRFSTLGMISVAALILSGIVNAWILVGSFRALLATDYGQLLLVKIVAFVVMVGFAAVNRFWLTPRLALVTNAQAHTNALSALTRNTLIEIALRLAIFAVVGVLGTLHPAIHLVNPASTSRRSTALPVSIEGTCVIQGWPWSRDCR